MPSRRRGEELEAAILEAAWAEIQEHGYQRLTIEGVAARVQTGKQVLYRRWPNRVHLAVAAIRHVLGPLVETVPDAGSLREDYLTVLRLMAGRARFYTPELLHGLLSEMPGLHDFFSTLPGFLAEILRRAAARGEITHADLPDRVINLPLDLVRYEGMRGTRNWATLAEVDLEKFFAEILDDVFLPLVMALAGPRNPEGRPPIG
ncbi:TetR/AcrR family transcriptional regulator [Paractinoplanes durhamensis]|uniref:TetR family transcriptional regulator n=1 Tax=Paractinoplanes durhamensis TaxID=113563 RepID=A0ABQ3YU67_9ACTN|nr:TetR/AcrR family transcriptional regulator [Actinoplanes durhamensis]GIE01128.1 TetR family transcriptional regulator [Actinoplanes durhamensis]